eukprot:UN0414
MVLALNVSVYFCKLLPLHMNGNLPVGIGMHVFAMICDLIHVSSVDRCSAIIYVFHACLCVLSTVDSWCEIAEFITFTFQYSLSLSFGFNICWYSSNLFPNAFLRIMKLARDMRFSSL